MHIGNTASVLFAENFILFWICFESEPNGTLIKTIRELHCDEY